MQVLYAELPPCHALEAIHLMVLGKEMPDKITKQDLTVLIAFLCRKLDWIEEYETSCISYVSSAADIHEQEHQLTEKMTDKVSTDDCMANQPEKEQDILRKTEDLDTIEEQIIKEENITGEEPQTVDLNKKDSLNNSPQITKDRVTKMTLSLRSESHQKNITKRSGPSRPKRSAKAPRRGKKGESEEDEELSSPSRRRLTPKRAASKKIRFETEDEDDSEESGSSSDSSEDVPLTKRFTANKKQPQSKTSKVKKPFECEECEMTFTSKFSLQVWTLKRDFTSLCN